MSGLGKGSVECEGGPVRGVNETSVAWLSEIMAVGYSGEGREPWLIEDRPRASVAHESLSEVAHEAMASYIRQQRRRTTDVGGNISIDSYQHS